MFANKIFGVTILISSVWHLFWISAVEIVVTPTINSGCDYQEVNFLGPILEKTAFDIMADDYAHYGEARYAASSIFFLDRAHLKAAGPKRHILDRNVPEKALNRFTFNLQGYINDAKEIPFYMAEQKDFILLEEKEMPKVEGPVKGREIIHKPDSPVVASESYGANATYSVEVRFAISHNGIVYRAEPLVSSGQPKIDIIAIRHVREWRFSPLSLVEREENNWGVVTVIIKSR
ncbi:MAG: hypothetical protein ISS91_03650 [Candidatus Omnitrophica bacterium]|nr:hypothetical protein [Candidatus Omnitrophota bacterium]